MDEKFVKLCDTQIIVGGSKQPIHAIRAVLEVRLPQLINSSLAKRKDKKGFLTVEYKGDQAITYDTLTQLLAYAYSGEIAWGKFQLRDVMILYMAAEKLDIPQVPFLCERYLKTVLALPSFFDMFKTAHSLNLAAIKSLCLDFAMLEYNKIIADRNGINILGLDLFQEITMLASSVCCFSHSCCCCCPISPHTTSLSEY
jgi:hypothetical protein